MAWEIIIGTATNNILYKIRESRITRIVWLMCCVGIYQNSGLHMSSDLMGIFVIGILGIVLVNGLYIPMRLLGSRKVTDGVKLWFVLVFVIVTVWSLNCASESGLINIVWGCCKIVIATLICTGIGLSLWNSLKVHSQEYGSHVIGKKFDDMNGWEFERWSATWLQRHGFENVTVTSGSGDYGIDVIAYKNNVKYGIQCKKYKGNVGWHAVEEAKAGAEYWGCQKAVVMTNSFFTKQAIHGASRIGVELWDCDCIEK